MEDFRFVGEPRMQDIGNIIGILEKPRLWVPQTDYPDYFDWLQKVETELQTEIKRTILAYSGQEPVGAVLYQRHKSRQGTVEIKNLSVSPDVRGRHVGSFLLRNAEVEALDFDYPDCSRLVLDAKLSSTGIIAFLIKHGYQPEAVQDLYGLGAGADLVMTKIGSQPMPR